MDETQFLLSRDLSTRIAAIDIGTNSIRLIVAETLRAGTYRVLDEEKESVRLGKSLASTGALDAEAMERALVTLRRMKQIADGFQVTALKAIATCAVREASNGEEFCRRALDEAGVTVQVVSAKKEAHLAFTSLSRSFDLAGKNLVMADIGGGSTEVVLANGTVIEAIYTTQLGAVRLSEQFGFAATSETENFEGLVEHIDRELRRRTRTSGFTPHTLFGSGGTFTSLAEMMMAAKRQVGLPLSGYFVSHAEVRHLLDRVRKTPSKDRRGISGLSPDRADIIVAGLAIIDGLLRRFRVNQVQVHLRGVRDGLILTMMDQLLGKTPQEERIDRDSAVDRFATQCGSDLVHEKHVAYLAGRIFTQVREPFGMNSEDQILLETAAKLQDVGYLVNYDDHHKHSYHLILNSRLPGFTPGELEIIANVARYHRGSNPKKKHANFRQLSKLDQRRVRRLAAILRLAGGLDRGQSQQVQDVEVCVGDHRVEFLVIADRDPDLDIWGARRRTEMFEKVFRREAGISWKSPEPRASPNGQAEEESLSSPFVE